MESKKQLQKILGKNYLIRKGNSLTLAKYPTMSVQEMRVVGLAAAQIKTSDSSFQTVLIPRNKVDQDMKYKELKILAEALMDRKVILKDTQTEFEAVQLVARCHIVKQSGFFEVDFHPKMANQLLDLRNSFTRIPEWVLLSMPTFYSLRIYEILKSHRDFVIGSVKKNGNHPGYSEDEKGNWMIEVRINIDEFRDMLGINEKTGKSYFRWGNLDARILKAGQDHFKQHSDFIYDYEGGKEFGRSFTYIDFVLRKNKQPVQLDLFNALEALDNKNYKDPSYALADDAIPEAGNPAQKPPEHFIEIPQEIIDRVPTEQWNTGIGCKTVCEEIASNEGIEAVEFYINFALNYPGDANSYGKVIRFARKAKMYEQQQESLKAMKEAEEAEARAEEEKLDAMVEFEYMSDVNLLRAVKSGNALAKEVWDQREEDKIQAEQKAEKKRKQALIDRLTAEELDELDSFAGERGTKKDRDLYKRYKKDDLESHLQGLATGFLDKMRFRHIDDFLAYRQTPAKVHEISIDGKKISAKEALAILKASIENYALHGE